MKPSTNQSNNLSRMTAILAANGRAMLLAQSLWEFFNFELYCTIVENRDSNRIRYEIDPNRFEETKIFISICANDRQEEGLVHELLHANLIPLGYPKYWFDGQTDINLAGGILNLTEHQIILPIFLHLGYASERFLGPCTLSSLEQEACSDVERMANCIGTPEGYSSEVPKLLRKYGMRGLPLYPANAIAVKRQIVAC